MSINTLTQYDIDRILSYLDLPSAQELPTPPLKFLSDHITILPPPLLLPFDEITSPRERATIPAIKSRRLIYAAQSPLPVELHADRGRLRWPLLWERMGGSSLPPPSADVREEEKWVEENFLPGKENSQHVKKLGGFLRGLEEEREMESVVMARRAERRLDDVGEEFDEESDEEGDGVSARGSLPGEAEEKDQVEVREAFEKRILELFVDGMDTVPYAEVDFTDPPEGDPIAARDQEDAYFEDEEPSKTPGGHEAGEAQGRLDAAAADALEKATQNGQGDYDY